MGDLPAQMDYLSFNPTLVRLRRGGGGDDEDKSSPFQSHAGSIEAYIRIDERQASRSFQSHAGSIEAGRIIQGILISSMRFQSHAGSIEALSSPISISHLLKVSIPRWFD